MSKFRRIRGETEKATLRFEPGILVAVRRLAVQEKASEAWMVSQLLREALEARGIRVETAEEKEYKEKLRGSEG